MSHTLPPFTPAGFYRAFSPPHESVRIQVSLEPLAADRKPEGSTGTSEARALACPNCGALVKEGSPACTYCKAELRTVRCHFCYQLNAAVGSFCSGCGKELGLEPVPAQHGEPCRECGGKLSAFHSPAGSLLDCAGCGAQFVDHALLVALLERREIVGTAVPAVKRANPLAQGPVRYRRCPTCNVLMNRKNFGDESGVIVDICNPHGTLFDAGELPRVMQFVASGGLARAEQRKRERDARRPRPAAAPQAVTGREHVDDEGIGVLAEGLLSLLAFVAKKL
jgi:Zn-finger nucleic acid-binding protein